VTWARADRGECEASKGKRARAEEDMRARARLDQHRRWHQQQQKLRKGDV
jgi:hypothetical protein